MKKKNTRDYGKETPDTRAGESDTEMRGYDGVNPWLTRKDPYPSGQEVDPPADDDGRGRVWPEDVRKRGDEDA